MHEVIVRYRSLAVQIAVQILTQPMVASNIFHYQRKKTQSLYSRCRSTGSYLVPFFHLLRAANHFDIPREYNEVNPRNPRSSARLRLDRVSSRRLIAEGCQRKRESPLLENVTRQ